MSIKNGVAPDYLLFGTEACQLCEEAVQLLSDAGIAFQQVEIMDKQEWLEKYSVFIPVLQHVVSTRELAWPFDYEQLLSFVDFMAEHGIPPLA